MSRRRFLALAILLVLAAAGLRSAWLLSNPPVQQSVGIVWHDEGAWVHNARNRALWGVWRTDAWNPVFVAPVFTGLEYVSFSAFGVGLWQARLVPVASGLVALAALMAGLAALYGHRAALLGGMLLATNYVFVMWNRAALMESTMTAALVVAWAGYAASERRPGWAWLAGAAAAAAWFTKAAAAFFIAALVIECLTAWLDGGTRRRVALSAAAGLALAFLVAGLAFVLPYWQEYQFYNWQMSVTRKPEYSVRALVDRASWLPLVHDIFTRMWLVLVAAGAVALSAVTRWRETRPGERLLVLWVLVGLAELVVHDSGNERRYVMFIPALIAMAVAALHSGAARVGAATHSEQTTAWRRPIATVVLAAPVVLLFGYLLAASLLRPFFIEQVAAGQFSAIVRTSALAAVLLAGAVVWRLPAIAGLAARARASRTLVAAAVAVTVAGDTWSYGVWLAERDNENYEASLALGQLLQPGTLVHGKLANGMALDNRIRPVFVGNGFGNYEDRLNRPDARYILTYDLPRIGYESSDGSGLIQGILDHYPQHRVIATFPVDETPGPDRAALIDKFAGPATHARD